MSFDIIRTSLASAVADAGTFTVTYPTGRGSGSYEGGKSHEVVSTGYGRLEAKTGAVSFAFGASEITVTNNSGQTLPADLDIIVQLDIVGGGSDAVASQAKMTELQTVIVTLGAPIASDSDGAVASQACTASGVSPPASTVPWPPAVSPPSMCPGMSSPPGPIPLC